MVEIFQVSHYNFQMFGVLQILVSPCLRTLALAAAVVAGLAACGQKGPLFLPTEPAAAGRASLTEILAPSTAVSGPQSPASAVPATGKASPVRNP
ncbi:lipoprotein [Ramlibacter sp.]|uniref:LPS translocon maturation chaperone LptM n=1 Tax=Ramlibacter sp. TaxID=1917967 RepID=UPI00262EE725|nr:lipoprotein [Ramlibacter sp.]